MKERPRMSRAKAFSVPKLLHQPFANRAKLICLMVVAAMVSGLKNNRALP